MVALSSLLSVSGEEGCNGATKQKQLYISVSLRRVVEWEEGRRVEVRCDVGRCWTVVLVVLGGGGRLDMPVTVLPIFTVVILP